MGFLALDNPWCEIVVVVLTFVLDNCVVAEIGIRLFIKLHLPCGGKGGVQYGSDRAASGIRARRGQAQHVDGSDSRPKCVGSTWAAVVDAGVCGDEEGSRCSGGLAVSHGFPSDHNSR